jgi:hypothetical protein
MTATTISTTGITLITITGRIAEIIVDPTSKAITAGELVLFMLAHGITAAKIVRISNRKESPPPRFDQEGGGQSHHKRRP